LPVIGYLSSLSEVYSQIETVPFLQALKETGYVEGQNLAPVEYRWAENQPDRLPALAADLIRLRVSVIVASGIEAALAAKAATTTIPIVFNTGSDPVTLGLVASLNRPGANVTGSVALTAELAPKRLQLLRQLIPNAARFGVLADPVSFPDTQSAVVEARSAPRSHPTGSSLGHMARQAGIYTGRILKGEKPADLPVQQATKLDLVINQRIGSESAYERAVKINEYRYLN
jgi:putative ABC transport system substrate-binding protein